MDYDYTQENGYVEPVKTGNSGVAIAALICGIVSLISCCNLFYIFSIAAIVLGIIGLCQTNRPKGMAIAGLVMGCVWPVIDILMAFPTAGLSFFL